MPSPNLLTAALLALGSLAAQQQPPPTPTPLPGMRPFQNRANSFRIDLPEDWRQLAPAETQKLAAAIAPLPADLGKNEPAMFYAVGPIDRWLGREFDGRYLYVVEQDNEWHSDENLAARLEQMWRDKGAREGIDYAVAEVQQITIGRDKGPAVSCIRTIGAKGLPQQKSLDVHIPTGGQELTLCFFAWAADFDRELPRYRQLLDTIELARPARGEAQLSDRLWTPLVAGAVVGLCFVLAYRHTRRRAI